MLSDVKDSTRGVFLECCRTSKKGVADRLGGPFVDEEIVWIFSAEEPSLSNEEEQRGWKTNVSMGEESNAMRESTEPQTHGVLSKTAPEAVPLFVRKEQRKRIFVSKSCTVRTLWASGSLCCVASRVAAQAPRYGN